MGIMLYIAKFLISLCEKTGRVLTITGTGDDTDVYLIRYYLFRSSVFNVFIHVFLRSDRDDLHDHPWDFATLVLRGSYVEHLAVDRDLGNIKTTIRSTTLSPVILRKAESLHKVALLKNYSVDEKEVAPMTLCVTGPTRREWGFVRPEPAYSDGRDGSTPGSTVIKINRHWVPWREYLGLPDDEPGRG